LIRSIFQLFETGSLSLACITAQLMGATPRFNAIIALLTMRSKHEPEFAKLIKKANALLQRSYEVAELRNRIVHDPWFVEERSRQTAQLRMMPRKELHYGLKPIGRQHVRTALANIAEFSERVRQFAIDVFDARLALRERHHEAQP
jgi:hypothetical protein